MTVTTKSIDRVALKLLEKEQEWFTKKEPTWGLSTGFRRIDHATGGLHKGEVTVLGARTSHGKTSLASSIAFHVAEQEYLKNRGNPSGKVLYFSPEMTAEQLVMRRACQLARVSSLDVHRGNLTEEQRQAWQMAVAAIGNLSPVMELYAGESMDISTIRGIVESNEGQILLIVIDYLQRLTVGVDSHLDYGRVSLISTSIKDLANRFEVPILVLSQLNRALERDRVSGNMRERRPTLSDLRDSGRIEEDADVVWLLWRDPDQNQYVAWQDANLEIAKSRNGKTGDIPLRFYPEYTLFEDPPSQELE